MDMLLDGIKTTEEENRDYLTPDEWVAAIEDDPELMMQLLDRIVENRRKDTETGT